MSYQDIIDAIVVVVEGADGEYPDCWVAARIWIGKDKQ